MNYGGIYQRWVPAIIRFHEAGFGLREISRACEEIVAKLGSDPKWGWGRPEWPTEAMARYILMTEGRIRLSPCLERKQKRKRRSRTNLGRPIDMGGARDRWLHFTPESPL